MKAIITFVFLSISLLGHQLFAQSIGWNNVLEKAYHGKNNQDLVELILVPKAQYPIETLREQFEKNPPSAEYRMKTTMRELQAFSQSQATIWRQILEEINQEPGCQVSLVQDFWLVHAYQLKANRKAAELLAKHPMTRILDRNADQFMLEEPVVKSELQPETINGNEPGLLAIKAPFMWNLGYTGRGRKFLSVDTGIWPRHPSVKNRFLAQYKPLKQSWRGFDRVLPADKGNSHGTHTTGTVLGLDSATRDTIGVAFGAYFIATDPIVSDLSKVRPYTDLLGSLQWALNPDQDTSTVDDVPDAINNSWGRSPNASDTVWCNSFIGPGLLNLATAGIAVVFSAGNNGPGNGTIGLPATINTSSPIVPFTVGALNGNTSGYPIANFSSRGPSLCGGNGAFAIKPEVSAPGENVRSAVGQNGYALYSGTSMACPHTVGAVLLLKEAFPQLSGETLCNALYQSASDLGAPGEDNVYGKGIIDVQAAYNWLITQNHTPVPPKKRAYELVITKMLNPEVDSPYVCMSAFSPLVEVVNNGDSTLRQITLTYQSGTQTYTHPVITSLAPGAKIAVQLGSLPIQSGVNELKVNATHQAFNQEYDEINNLRYFRITNLKSDTLSTTSANGFFEDFEQFIPDNNRWYIANPDTSITWDTVVYRSTVGAFGKRSAIINCRDYSPRRKQIDDLISRNIAYTPGQNLALSFAWAYRLRQSNLRDSLQISYSTDCGLNYLPLLQMGSLGMITMTVDTPSLTTHFKDTTISFVPAGAGTSGVSLRFRSINDFGGNIYLDNISVRSLVDVADINRSQPWKVYPNPAREEVEVAFSENFSTSVQLTICNLSGQEIRKFTIPGGNPKVRLPLQGISPGVYLLRNQFGQTTKLVIH